MNTLERQQDFTLVKLLFVRKGRALSDGISSQIDTKADDMLCQMKHDIDWCGDPKVFYEKEIPYRIEMQVRRDMQQWPEVIARQYAADLNWLQGILKHLGCQYFSIPLYDYNIVAPVHLQEKLNLIDIHKTRLYSRIGTLFVALCLSQFGIGAFVGSMLCGTGAEELLLSRSGKSKESIKQIMPSIVENYRLQMKARILGVLAEVDSNIMNELNKLKL